MNKNVTIRLDETVLRKARHAAVQQDQSLSQWLATLINRATFADDNFSQAREEALKLMRRGFNLGGKPLSRDKVHER